MEFEENGRIILYFKNIPDPDVQKEILDDPHKYERRQPNFKPDKHLESSKKPIRELDRNLNKWWYERTRDQPNNKLIEGFKYLLIRWVLNYPIITTNQLSEDTLDLLEKFDRYYEQNKNNQIILF